MKKKPAPLEMFTAGDDLPLFSLSPMKVDAPKPYNPNANRRQPSLFSTAGTACPICYGSGEVITRKNKPPTRCTCQAGQRKS